MDYQIIVFSLLSVYLGEVLGQVESTFKCPEKTGYYPDPVQCDLYYRCVDGELNEEKLCPDGLLFDDSNPNRGRCDHPHNVDCGDRNEQQEPKPSKGCPRANGVFRHPDPLVCDKFVNCIEGEQNELPCPPGLIYDDSKASCVWPVENTRLDCTKSKKDQLEDGFSCPDGEIIGPNGRALPHPTFPHPEDCQKFYICRNGVTPQHGSCSAGYVYNEASFKCDDPANVPGCRDAVVGLRERRSKNQMVERTVMLEHNYYVPHSFRPPNLPRLDRLLDEDYYSDDYFQHFDYPNVHVKSDIITHSIYDDADDEGETGTDFGGPVDVDHPFDRLKNIGRLTNIHQDDAKDGANKSKDGATGEKYKNSTENSTGDSSAKKDGEHA